MIETLRWIQSNGILHTKTLLNYSMLKSTIHKRKYRLCTHDFSRDFKFLAKQFVAVLLDIHYKIFRLQPKIFHEDLHLRKGRIECEKSGVNKNV